MALSVEASELLEIFQWPTSEESIAFMQSDRADDVWDELADVAIYRPRLADVLDVDLDAAVEVKISRNNQRFPTRTRTRPSSP